MSLLFWVCDFMRYRDQRFASDLQLRVEQDEQTYRAQLVNVSTTGARLSVPDCLPVAARVTLCYLHLRFPARVVWSSDQLTGLRFLLPLSRSDLHLLRGSGGRRAGSWGTSHGPFYELG